MPHSAVIARSSVVLLRPGRSLQHDVPAGRDGREHELELALPADEVPGHPVPDLDQVVHSGLGHVIGCPGRPELARCWSGLVNSSHWCFILLDDAPASTGKVTPVM